MASLPMIASGGGSGSELKISVFYTEEFYGETISCSKGSTTLTETATSSGEVEFTVAEEGIWTVSCTVDGNLYETEVTVYYDYPATLLAVPEGSTATPTDDIQLWLKCADITHLNYTLLAQVMADEFTFDTLLRDSNACDYMARSTTWASSITDSQSAMELIGKYNYCSCTLLGNSTWNSAIVASSYADSIISALVPTMTSNTTPSDVGQCIYSTTYGGSYDAYKAFDGNDSTGWCPANGDSIGNAYLGYEFTSPKIITKMRLLSDASRVTSFKLQGYNNGTWDDLATITNRSQRDTTYTFANSVAYSKYRVLVTASQETVITSVQIDTLQFYGHEAQTNIIHSAANDTIYYLDNEGNEVVLATTNADGIGEVDWSLLDTGNYTLYSTVAKKPANLTDDYGKTVKVTSTPKGSTTELYVMPRHSLYWYGYDSNDLEDMTQDNGWTVTGAAVYFIGATHNTNSVYLNGSAGNYCGGIGSKEQHQVNNLYAIAEKSGGSNEVYLGSTGSQKKFKASSSGAGDNFVGIYNISSKDKYTAQIDKTGYIDINTWTSTQATLYAMWYDASYDGEGNLISAAYDEVYFYLNGEKVVFAVTDDKGYANLDYSRIPSGFYTLYSSVAKLPSDLSLPYFKRVEITENTTEISLMPDNVLYWYGYESANLEDATADNGWSFSNYTLVAPTHNTNYINMSGANGKLSGVASKSKVNGTNAYAIATGVRTDNGYGYLNAENSKAMAFNTQTKITSSSMTKYSVALNNQYVCVEVDGAREINLHAMWYDTTPSTTPTMYSAAEDTLYIYDANNNVVPIATTNSEGKYYGEIPLAEGTYTIYSSVAKDPENLSQPYSKSITITSQTTSISMMPENALYWYGYMSSDCEEMSTTNGWTADSGYTWKTPTYNTNSVTITGTESNTCGIAKKTALASASTLKAIVTPKELSSFCGWITSVGQKNLSSGVAVSDTFIGTVNTTMLVTSTNTANYYPILYTRHTRSFDAHAFWYE